MQIEQGQEGGGDAHMRPPAVKWKIAMPNESKTDDVEKFLAEQKAIEDRRQALIADLLRQREAAMNDFDEKLAKLGHNENSGRSKRSHHRKSAAPEAQAKQKDKSKS